MDTIKEIIKRAKKLNLSKDDLIQEAELVEDCGEWYHISLMGFSADEIKLAANNM